MLEPARTDSLILLAHALGRSRAWIVAHPEAPVSKGQEKRFMALCERRARGTPIAYILGSAGFYGRDFLVDDTVLVPRPETEHLIDESVDFIRKRPREARVLDVGIGCGAIACTVAAETSARVEGTDIAAGAVAIAKTNARRLGVSNRCAFHRGDLAAPVRGRRFDVIVANLPYVPAGDVPQAPSPLAFEPRIALDGGPDGLAVYRRLMPQLPALLDPNALVLLEAAPPTIETLKQLVYATLPGFAVSVGHDYANLPRYIRAARNGA